MAYTETFVDSTGETHTLKPRFHRQARMRYRAESLEELFAEDFKLLKQYINHHQYSAHVFKNCLIMLKGITTRF